MSTIKCQQETKFDQTTNNSYMIIKKLFNQGIKNNSFLTAFKKQFKLESTEIMPTTNFEKAYIYIRDRDYPTPQTSWELISSREASKILEKRFSYQHLTNMANEDNTFRLCGAKFYKNEIELFKKLLDFNDAMYKFGFIFDSKDDSGKDVIVVLKKSITSKGLPEYKQRMAAFEHAIKDPEIWGFIEKLKNN